MQRKRKNWMTFMLILSLLLFNTQAAFITSSFATTDSRFGEVLVSDTGTSATIEQGNTSRNLAVAPDGTIYAVYQCTEGIRVAKSSDEGNTFLPSVLVFNQKLEAEIAVSSDSSVYVAWVNGSDAYLTKSIDCGQTFQTPVKLGAISRGMANSVHMAVDGKYVYVIDSSGVNFYYSSDGGLNFIKKVYSVAYAFSDVHVDVASGNVILQKDNPSIAYFISSDHGATFGAPVVPGKMVSFSVGSLASGVTDKYLYIAGSNVNLEKIDLNTGTTTTSAITASTNPYGRSLSADAFGNVVTGFNNGTDVQFQVSNDYGSTFSTASAVAVSTLANAAINSTNGDILYLYERAGKIYLKVFASRLVGYDLSLSSSNLFFNADTGVVQKTVRITNVSNAAITINQVLTAGNYTVDRSALGGTLAAGASADIIVTFHSSGPTTQLGTITIKSSSAQDRVILLTGTSTQEASITCSMTYNGNGNTGGTVPVDATAYTTGSAVTVAANTGNLAKTGYTFAGWNTATDGSGTSYATGSTFNITTNSALYAKWNTANSGGTSGSTGSTGSSGGSGSHTSTAPSPSTNTGINVVVNGKVQQAGTETGTIENGKTSVKLDVDEPVLSQKIDDVVKENIGKLPSQISNKVEIPVSQKNVDNLSVVLTGDIIKKLENNDFTLSVNESSTQYHVPAKEFTIDAVASKLGVSSEELKKIEIEIKINKVSDALNAQYESMVKANQDQLLVKPVEFEIVAKVAKTNGETSTYSVNKFSSFVERVIEIPEGIDISKITTGIVFHADGTYSHVPTTVFSEGGKNYARLNSLTNSAYSVVYNPVVVKSVQKHWAKNQVNDLASRMVIGNPDKFNPDRAITRAEFAEYITKALGLYRTGESFTLKFKDVKSNNPYASAINKATEYGIISGYQDGSFKPNGLITREEAMVMYSKAMKLAALSGQDKTLASKYSDAKSVSAWAKADVTDVVAAKVFNGKTKTQLSPKSNLTCAEAATAIRNLLTATHLINQ